MSKSSRQLVGDARAKAAIEHLLAAVEALNAACRDLCAVNGAAHHYRAISKLSDSARSRAREIDLDHARSGRDGGPYELSHDPDPREIDEPHFACVARGGAS